jgi:DNA-binding MarR family transcriptional regulator
MPDKNLFESTFESLHPDDHRMRAWLALVGCFTSVERTLRRRFSRSFNSRLPRYDVLTALVQFPDGLTMGQLATKLVVSKGNITGVVGRLHEHRLVRQAKSRGDRRVQLVTVTDKGRELWERMHTEYCAVVDELMSAMTTDQAKSLTRSLAEAQQDIDTVLQRADQNEGV